MSTESNTPSQVTWHVLFWVLPSLAISSMAQSAGRLCGTSSRYRIYLASSPILCCADAVSMVLSCFTVYISLSVASTQALRVVLGRRMETGHRGLELDHPRRSTWPSLLFFLLGTLPAAIKLTPFSGILWTKTWGMMFLSSFIISRLSTLLGAPPHMSCLTQSSITIRWLIIASASSPSAVTPSTATEVCRVPSLDDGIAVSHWVGDMGFRKHVASMLRSDARRGLEFMDQVISIVRSIHSGNFVSHRRLYSALP
jgi:hypothetical protein